MTREKKRKPSRKQLKKQRRDAIARKRKEQGWEPRQAPSVHDEVVADMLPLLARLGDDSMPGPAMEQLMMTLLASEDLVGEPEFEEIVINPILCVEVFAEVSQELGVDPDSLGERELSDEEREGIQMDILEGATQRLLTDELRQDIVNRLNNLRLRLKRSGKREEAARAAALQSFLGERGSSEIWPMVGLVQAICHRNFMVGVELLEASMEVMETDSPDKSDVPLAQKLAQSSLTQKMDTLLEKVPGLRGFMEKQVDSVWEEGVDAIFAGDLKLDLFSPEELEAGFEIFNTVFGHYTAEETATQDPLLLEVPQEEVTTLVLRLDGYIAELFTPERLDQLRARLDTIMKDSAYKGKWLTFIFLLAGYMAEEDAVENEKLFLIKALLSEMRAVATASQEADD